MPDYSTWRVARVQKNTLLWGRVKRTNAPHRCRYCDVVLLTGEDSGFCCGPNGSMLDAVSSLPPFPDEYNAFLSDPRISSLSRLLNLVYTFAQLESTQRFPTLQGPPGHFAVQGKLFHRVRPDHLNSAVHWLLYDGFMAGRAPFSDADWFSKLPQTWITALGAALLRVNPFVRAINVFRYSPESNLPNVRLQIREAGENEIAAIMCFDNTVASDAKYRSIVISKKSNLSESFVDDVDDTSHRVQRISVINRMWEPLVYPLLFPHGTLGWGRADRDTLGEADYDSPTSQIWHCRALLLREERFSVFGRLTNEYVCDMFTRNLESRLSYIRTSQLHARREDAVLMGVEFVADAENVFLPSSFLGSNAWCSEQIADALTIAANCGVPTFFITMTCNPDWPEIREKLRPGQAWQDAPVVVARVFKQKLAALMKLLKVMFPNAGKIVYRLYAVEFQKRGLPHCHILIKYERDCVLQSDIDSVVSAELPTNPVDAQLVKRYMTHNHPNGRITTYCKPAARKFGLQSDADSVTCRFGYPKAVREHTTIGFDGRPQYRRRHQEDEWVVPHCLPLLRALECHINFEVANSSHLYQYLFKYIRKGVDRAQVRLRADGAPVIDEVEEYWRARYLSAGEATWRLLGFRVASKSPSVTGLVVHLPSSRKHRQYRRTSGATSTLSMLDRYFHRPTGTFTWRDEVLSFAELTYTDFYTKFRHVPWDDALLARPNVFRERNIPQDEIPQLLVRRSEDIRHFVRIAPVKPSQGELFYFRALLNIRPAASYYDARTVDGVTHPSYQAAAQALGLFADKREAEYALHEAVQSLRTPRQMRFLFVHLIVHDAGEVDFPLNLWALFRDELSIDFYLELEGHQQSAYSRALDEISQMLDEFGHTLQDFNLPLPDFFTGEVAHELDRWGPHSDRFHNHVTAALASFTHEQRRVFNEVTNAVEDGRPLCIFLDGKAGRGKTYLISAICDFVRSRREIVLPTATSAFAALLYEGGRTTHSCFKIPVEEHNELLRSPIESGDTRAQLIREFRVLVWDESPMANRAALSCVEETCRRIMGNNLPFGGKIIVLAGDFRQTCPVVRKGTRAQVSDASIRSSNLWPLFVVRRLTIPLRQAEDVEYAEWVDSIGDGAGPQVDLHLLRHVHSDAAMIDFVFPPDILQDPRLCLKRSILCPTNRQIEHYNGLLLSRVAGVARTYLAADRIKEDDEAGMPERVSATLDYAARTHIPGVPSHSLTIKTNAVFRLMRNFSISRGLVKNVRVVIVDVGTRLVTVRILRDTVAGVVIDTEDVLIPRITFDVYLPETRRTLQRRQFPLAPAYATTFNSCQGLTLDTVALDLRRPVFSHGQLYTALSRVRRREHAVIRLPPGQTQADNVTYTEILL